MKLFPHTGMKPEAILAANSGRKCTVTSPAAAVLTAAVAAPSFGLVSFFDPPPAAAAMGALLGWITCPSGLSFA